MLYSKAKLLDLEVSENQIIEEKIEDIVVGNPSNIEENSISNLEMTILLVEDNMLNQVISENQLKRMGKGKYSLI